jgi:YVTN family beta-propeller protein
VDGNGHRVVLVGMDKIPPLLRTVSMGCGPSALAVGTDSGRVFVANYADGSVSVLDAHIGTVQRPVAVGRNPDAVAVDTRTGRVFGANGNVGGTETGSISVLDAGSGTLLRTVGVGHAPRAIAVHERTGHVFVTNSGDNARGAAWVCAGAGAGGTSDAGSAMPAPLRWPAGLTSS